VTPAEVVVDAEIVLALVGGLAGGREVIQRQVLAARNVGQRIQIDDGLGHAVPAVLGEAVVWKGLPHGVGAGAAQRQGIKDVPPLSDFLGEVALSHRGARNRRREALALPGPGSLVASEEEGLVPRHGPPEGSAELVSQVLGRPLAGNSGQAVAVEEEIVRRHHVVAVEPKQGAVELVGSGARGSQNLGPQPFPVLGRDVVGHHFEFRQGFGRRLNGFGFEAEGAAAGAGGDVAAVQDDVVLGDMGAGGNEPADPGGALAPASLAGANHAHTQLRQLEEVSPVEG